MEDCVSERMYLITAIFAFEAFAITHAVVAGFNYATFRTGGHVAIRLFEHVVEAGIIIWEAFVELFDGESHYLLVYYRGYML